LGYDRAVVVTRHRSETVHALYAVAEVVRRHRRRDVLFRCGRVRPLRRPLYRRRRLEPAGPYLGSCGLVLFNSSGRQAVSLGHVTVVAVRPAGRSRGRSVRRLVGRRVVFAVAESRCAGHSSQPSLSSCSPLRRSVVERGVPMLLTCELVFRVVY